MEHQRTSSTSHSARLLVGGHSVDQSALTDPKQGAMLQDWLNEGRQRFGHALCLCRRSALKLQIRLRDGKYHLAVWPNEGELHDARCHFFRDELEHTAIEAPTPNSRDTAAGASPTDTGPIGRHAVRLYMPNGSDKALSTERTPQDKRQNPSREAPTARAVNLKTLSMMLWREASLCRWHPAWERDWGRSRYELMRVAKTITVNDKPLDSMVFVPKPFRESARDTLNQEWDRFVNALGRRNPAHALLIAPVKSHSVSNNLLVMHLRHLRHPIGLSQAAGQFVESECRNAMRQIQSNFEYPRTIRHDTGSGMDQRVQRMPDRHNPEVIGFFLVESSSRGGLWAKAAWLMSVHPTLFIPANNPNHVLLIDSLVSHGHTFSRILTDVSPSRKQAPDWVVRHVVGPSGQYVPRAALEILDKGVSADFLSARADLAHKMAQQGVPTWYWVPSGSWAQRKVPPLPPLDSTDHETAMRSILDMQRSAHSDYRNGPSPHFNPERRVP